MIKVSELTRIMSEDPPNLDFMFGTRRGNSIIDFGVRRTTNAEKIEMQEKVESEQKSLYLEMFL
jgi:hypothetical protein